MPALENNYRKFLAFVSEYYAIFLTYQLAEHNLVELY